MPSDTNKGTNPQGNITVQFNSKQAPDGVSTYAVFHRYLIKSTSISSLVKLANGVEQFNAKGVVQDLTTGASIIGGATVQVTVTDGQYGAAADRIRFASASITRRTVACGSPVAGDPTPASRSRRNRNPS